MTQIFSIVGVAALLWCEGYLVAGRFFSDRADRFIAVALAYPLGVFVQTLLFFVLAVLGLPWSLAGVGIGHAVVLAALFFSRRFGFPPASSVDPFQPIGIDRRLFAASAVLLAVIALASIVHAATIPSFYWDTFTNWAMRSKQSFVAGEMLLTGVVQPQYPILVHSLQTSPMFLAGWHDRLANVMTLLLSLSGCSALFLLVRKDRGTAFATLLLALLLSVPLVVIHLRQGYADVHLSLFVLLSAALLDRALQSADARLLLLSAVFCAAAMWTKLEGLYAGVGLWIIVVAFHALRTKRWAWSVRWGIAPLVALVLPWLLFLWFHGLKTSPHGFRPALHFEALPAFLDQLFLQGMFGLHWWAIASLVAIVAVANRRSLASLPSTQPSLPWGVLAFAFFAFAYLCTEEVRGLVNADNFSRAMMMPTLLLTYALAEHRGCLHSAKGVVTR